MSRKDALKVLFETGKIPMGEHFAEFIDDAYNNYKLVDMFNPNQPPDEFEEGENILVFNYNPATNPDWLNLFGPNVPAGDIMVRTLAYPKANVWLQEFDTNRNGRYYANKSRSSTDGIAWGGIVDHPEVLKVNNQLPDDNGNVTISDDGGEVIVSKPEVTFHTYQYELGTPNWVYEFDIEVPNYNPDTDVIEVYRTSPQNPNRVKEIDFEILSYTEPTMRIGLLNGSRTNRDYPIGLWRYKYSNKPRLDATVVDGFGSTSADDASSINNATILNNKIAATNDDVEYMSEALKAHMQQYANNEGDPGHVILDGTTIIRNQDGTISAVGGGSGEGGGVTHIQPLPPTAGLNDYPMGISIFAVHFDEGDLSWYNALNLYPTDLFEEETGHPPYGKVSVMTTKTESLLMQIIQVFDGSNNSVLVGRHYTRIEGRWSGGANRETGLDGSMKKFNGIAPNMRGNVAVRTELNRIWDSRPIAANAPIWTVDFSDEEELTDLNNYWFEVYDDGVLVFGNPITYVVDNDTKTVTFTPTTPMARAFTITCIGRGMEYPQ